MNPVLAVVGNISIDDVTYPSGLQYRFVGGAGLHVALAAARTGLATTLVSVVGSDLDGVESYLRTAKVGIDNLLVAPGPTCRFHISYDAAGDLVAVDASFGVAAGLTAHVLESLGPASAYHVSCRRPLDPAALLPALPLERTSIDFFGPSADTMMQAVSAAVGSFTTIFVNAAEQRVLSEIVDLRIVRCLLVTDGPRTARVWRYGEESALVLPPSVHAAEVTGAGDTLTGTFLAAHHLGASDQDALEAAVLAASSATSRIGLTTLQPDDGNKG